jgi:hypothetical protein
MGLLRPRNTSHIQHAVDVGIEPEAYTQVSAQVDAWRKNAQASQLDGHPLPGKEDDGVVQFTQHILDLVDVAALIRRTALEDHMLQQNLPGYADYSGKLRFRLVPGVW